MVSVFNICDYYNNTRALLAEIRNPGFPDSTVTPQVCRCRIRIAKHMTITTPLLLATQQGRGLPLLVTYFIDRVGYTWPDQRTRFNLGQAGDDMIIATNVSFVDIQMDTNTTSSQLVFRIKVTGEILFFK